MTNPSDTLFLLKLKAVIDEDLDNSQLNSDLIAQKMLLSRAHLYRKLKALTNQSVAIFVRNYRLKKAQQLLQKTDWPVQQIAFSVGFNNPKYFTRTFKEVFKMSPSIYRKEMKS